MTRALNAAERRALGGGGAALGAVAWWAYAANHHARSPGYAWHLTDSIADGIGVISAVTAIGAGLWLWNRLPVNPTGARMVAAGYCFAGFLASSYWPARVAPWVSLVFAISLRPLLFTAVLAWPTGRLDRRTRRTVRWLTGAYVLFALVPFFVGAPPEPLPWGWQTWPVPLVGSASLGRIVGGLDELVLSAALPVALIVALVHRRRRLPEGARRFTTPALAAGVIAASADFWVVMSSYVAANLEFDASGLTAIGLARAIVDYGRFGAVGILFVIDSRSRRKAALDAPTARTVELAPSTRSKRTEDQLGRLLGDPTVLVRWWRGDRWVDVNGAPVPVGGRGRAVIELVDAADQPMGVIEHRADIVLAPSAVEAAAAQLQLGLVVGQRTAESAARLAELRAVQRALLDAQDGARRRLERDLHDGAQQQLVGLALQARLDARAADLTIRRDLAAALAHECDVVLGAVRSARPAVLDAGLAGALTTLASGLPVPTTLRFDGDLVGEDPAATTAWFLACDAVANVLKHGEATSVTLGLWVRGHEVELTVADNGCGGVNGVPGSLARRADDAGGTVTVDSPSGRGTVIVASIPRVVHDAEVGA